MTKFPCSICGSRDWPRANTQCPNCAADEEQPEPETVPATNRAQTYWMLAAGLLSLIIVLILTAAKLAADGHPNWALGCGCACFVCYLGFSVCREEYKIAQRNSAWPNLTKRQGR